MVSRHDRLTGALQNLYPNTTVEPDTQASIHNHQLEYITTRFEIPAEGSSTAAYRRAIRLHLLSQDNPSDSRFTTNELYRLSQLFRQANRLDTTQAIEFLEQCKAANAETISINGTDYAVTDYRIQHGCEAPGYDGYITATLAAPSSDSDWRLVAFYNWNSDGCWYDTGCALEERTGYDPYVKWKKRDYPHTLESTHSHVTDISSTSEPQQQLITQ